MSWLPFYNAWLVVVGIVSIFWWYLLVVLMFFFAAGLSVFLLFREVVLPSIKRYATAFWLFIASEVAVFGTLLLTVLWMDDGGEGSLSDSLELPFLGCFLLLTSSLTATIYHHSLGLPHAGVFLFLSIVLGVSFIFLQLFEFFDCECDLLYSTYMGAAFCTVGLHFTHVAVGVIGMIVLLLWGSSVSHYYASLVVWYWHFVDYVWLWVYLIVYYV